MSRVLAAGHIQALQGPVPLDSAAWREEAAARNAAGLAELEARRERSPDEGALLRRARARGFRLVFKCLPSWLPSP